MTWRIAFTALLLPIFFNASAQQLDVVAPTSFVSGKAFPFAVEVMQNNQVDFFYSETLSPTITGGQISGNLIKIKKGRGLATVQTNSANMLAVNATNIALSISENTNSPISHGGAISGSTTWSSGTVHRISSNVIVAANQTLTIEAGCWVLLDSAVNIIVNGTIKAEATRQNPITFCSNFETASWGGILINQGIGEFNYCFFNNGGGDQTQTFGHSNSQAVLKSTDGVLEMENCYIFDCVGKGIGAENGVLTFRNGAISRCDMGGEFGASSIQIIGSHVLDIPNDDGIFIDDDNDLFYFSGTHSLGASVVDSCVLMFGKDDAIDHNNAILEVRNSWIEGFENEGIAASNGNSIFVYNSLFKDCEQGIEAGYGSPEVTVDHCVMINNDNGLRFGDWYNWGSNGTITCTNSIMFDNLDNVYNFDVLANGPISGAIDLTYSLTNDIEYDNNIGCLAGQPNFNSQFLLQVGSVGVGLANDGLDMGLVNALPTRISEINPSENGKFKHFRILDMKGSIVFSGTDRTSLINANINIRNGIYIIEEVFESRIKRYKKMILQ